jgi:Tol biopolymer transport system component
VESAVNLTNTELGDENSPAWYPSGNKLVYASSTHRTSCSYPDSCWTPYDLYSIVLDDSDKVTKTTQLTFSSAAEWEPTVSPDGKKIAFQRGGEIFVMRTDAPAGPTNTPVNLTKNASSDYNPDWSPDGTKIAFASRRDGDSDIFVMNANGTNQTKLTRNAAFDGSPPWSPDGYMIAFGSDRDGDQEIWKMRRDGSTQTQVTRNTRYNDYNPTWRPIP